MCLLMAISLLACDAVAVGVKADVCVLYESDAVGPKGELTSRPASRIILVLRTFPMPLVLLISG